MTAKANSEHWSSTARVSKGSGAPTKSSGRATAQGLGGANPHEAEILLACGRPKKATKFTKLIIMAKRIHYNAALG